MVLRRSKSPSAVCSGFFSGRGKCSDAEFREAGLAVASIDKWVIDYMSTQPFIKRNEVVIVGQSGGGWGAIALGSQNPESVRAIIGFAAGRGGHLNGKPNNNCAPDQLVDAVAEFGRTARVPMLWIYARNDSYFGPDLSKRMVEAFRAAGGNVEFHLLADFGEDGHFLNRLGRSRSTMGAHRQANSWPSIHESFVDVRLPYSSARSAGYLFLATGSLVVFMTTTVMRVDAQAVAR